MEFVNKQKTFNLLILLTMVSFGFFGSVSHIFSLALIIFMYFHHHKSKCKNRISFNAIILFLGLSGCFFLFFLRSILHPNFGSLLHSLSPLLPLPFIATLIILQCGTEFKLKAKQVSHFAQVSVLFSLSIYLLLLVSTDPTSSFHSFHTGRLKLFSGNPIPFSFCMLGVSIFCLADWKNSSKIDKFTAFLLFLTGAYFAGFLSGTRGTLLSLAVIAPIIIFYISNNFRIAIFIISTPIFIVVLLFFESSLINLENWYFIRLKNGLETIIFLENSDSSIWKRLDMWSAAIKAFLEAPIFGYGITERFSALKPHLNDPSMHFSHPHNDIFAGLISIGFIGGITALTPLISGFAAAVLSSTRSATKLYFGLMISCSAIIVGNVSTVLFNDISSAWVAFSTFVIWCTDFKDNKIKV